MNLLISQSHMGNKIPCPAQCQTSHVEGKEVELLHSQNCKVIAGRVQWDLNSPPRQ